MKLVAALALLVFAVNARAQPLPDPGRRVDQPPQEEKAPAPQGQQKKKRPRISLKPKGGSGSSVGDDAPGGGPPAVPSRGGTPGTPSGSFTGAPPRP